MFRGVDGAIGVELGQRDRDLIGQIPELLGTVKPDEGDPAFRILHRDAYPEDSEASSEFEELTASDTRSLRRTDRKIVSAVGAGRNEITRDEAMALLRSINEARLVLAARSGVMDGGAGWESDIRDDPALAAVAWLGHIQGELISALEFDR
ncbi:MAG: DUF2017 family protein [Acidimicrobiia bacterium]